MPIQYLEGNDENIYALKKLGSTFTDAVLNNAAMRNRQTAAANNALLNSMYYQLDVEKAQRQAEKDKAGIDKTKAQTEKVNTDIAKEADLGQQTARIQRLRAQMNLGPNIMDIVKDPVSGPLLFGDLRTAGVMPQGATQLTGDDLLRRIALAVTGQVYGEGASAPGPAARLSLPVIGAPGATVRSGPDYSVIGQNAPAPISTYQQGQLDLGRQRFGEMQRHNQESERISATKTKKTGNDLASRIKDRMSSGSGGGSGPVKVATKQERDALPKGTQYIGPDGQIAIKQ